MLRGNLVRPGLVVSLLAAIPGYAFAQHSHEHSDTTAKAVAASHASHNMDDMDMGGAKGDWKMAAMAKHMAYSSSRPLTAADSIRSAQVVSELRKAIAKYQDVKVADADGFKMFAPQIKNQRAGTGT